MSHVLQGAQQLLLAWVFSSDTHCASAQKQFRWRRPRQLVPRHPRALQGPLPVGTLATFRTPLLGLRLLLVLGINTEFIIWLAWAQTAERVCAVYGYSSSNPRSCSTSRCHENKCFIHPSARHEGGAANCTMHLSWSIALPKNTKTNSANS